MRDPILNIAVNAARAAGRIIVRAADRLDKVHIFEKGPNDFVTDIDQQVEKEIIHIIHKAHPDHGIIGEEGGSVEGSEYTWIIDPIDGTRNFIQGLPGFCVSIAIQKKGRIEHGVIYDPMRQELFTATRGKGARLNDTRIRVSNRTLLKDTMLATGCCRANQDEGTDPLFSAHCRMIESIGPLCSGMRHLGSAALDLAYVACGRFDASWGLRLNIWDIAAGALLVQEAGGLVSDLNGEEAYLEKGQIVAGTPAVFKILLNKMRPCL